MFHSKSGTRSISFLFILLFSLACTQDGWAATSKKESKKKGGPFHKKVKVVVPKADPIVEGIGQAYLALEEGKIEKAGSHLNRVRSFQESRKFSDHLVFIEAEINREMGERLALTRTTQPKALGALNRAFSGYLDLYSRFPDSSTLPNLTEKISRVDFYRGQINRSIPDTERAFSRVFKLRYPANRIPFNQLTYYTQTCVINPTPVCIGWLRKTFESLPKKAPERAELEEKLPAHFFGKDPVESFERVTQSYKEELVLDSEEIEDTISIFLQGDEKSGIEKLESFVKTFPKSRQRMRAYYWLGALQKRKGRTKEAEKNWQVVVNESPFSYYSLLIHWSIGADPIPQLIRPETPPPSSRGTWLKPSEWEKLDRAEVFLKEGSKIPAAMELSDFSARREMPSSFLEYLAFLQDQSGNHLLAFSLVGELLTRGVANIVNLRTMEWLFPRTKYEREIFKNAENEGIDPLLALSLIKQESGFENGAMSHVGASGLMQVMPYTALDVDSNLRLEELMKPEINLKIGMSYLGMLLRRFKGNKIYALAAYNAGPNRADRWRQESQAHWGAQEFIESISFRETREYVSSILRNYYWYSVRLGKPKPKSLDDFWK